MTDVEYIRGFMKNDEKVISTFYKEIRPSFFAFFRTRYSKEDAYILDLFQDTCIVLWKNIQHGKLTEEGLKSALSTYLLSIGKYTMMAKDRKFKEIVNDSELLKLAFVEDDSEELRRRIELEDFVYRMVSEMKPPCDKLLKAQYWDKLSGAEIAEKYGYSGPDSVKTQKSKCIKKLRPLIEKYRKI